MKNYLVTGGAGFIGTNFIFHLLSTQKNSTVVNMDCLTYAGNLANFEGLNDDQRSRYEFVKKDITDQGAIQRIFDTRHFDCVVHFAAESHVDRSIARPEAFIETNICGTFNLLEASLRYWHENNKKDQFLFLNVSTDEVYGSLGPEGLFSESTPYDPSSPYSASKAAADHLVKAYFKTYGLPTIISNCSNNYGPYQFPEKLIPLMVQNIINGEVLPVYGDGSNVRDWLYVIDHCEALMTIVEKGISGESYNIGGGVEKLNIEIMHLLCELLDRKLGREGKESSQRLIRFVKDRPGHDKRYAIDCTKIKNELGWEARFGFEEALAKTVDWYINNQQWVQSIRSGEYLRWMEKHYGSK